MECEQQFSLSWNNFHGNVSRELSVLFGSGALADVTIAVGGELLKAHRLVLAICSPYFKKMFQTNPHDHPIVVLRDVSLKAMTDLLQFMYHGEVSVKREDLTSFIATAELLQIKGLTNKEGDEDAENQCNSQEITSQNTQNFSEKNQNKESTERRKILDERIEEMTQLKRTSEYLQNYFQSEQPEKKRCTNQRINENVNRNSHCEDTPSSLSYPDLNNSSNYEEALNLKTECDDDIIVTDPALNESKSYENCSTESNKDALAPLEDATGFRSFDLKGFADKFTYRSSNSEEHSGEHHLTTIPQKMDGKKKYPQRSCRSCGKLGRRKDTRFMCGYCSIPFCRYPCFDLHVKTAIGKMDDEMMRCSSFPF